MSSTIKPERLEILNKIKQYEKEGFFDTDVENDPDTKVLMPDDIDYLREKISNKIKSKIVIKEADKMIKKLIDSKQIIIKEVVGAENMKGIDESFFITSNHFHPFENIAIYEVFKQLYPKKHNFWRVIREGNYTAPPKGFDMFFRHANTLPLSSNVDTMKKFYKAVEVLATKKDNNAILMYPEQYMWWNYKKPRPFKDGVFKFSSKFNKPIVPCFITMKDSDILDDDGCFVQEYTVHIMPALYPDKNLSVKENSDILKQKNFDMWQKVYEKTYDKKLVYNGED